MVSGGQQSEAGIVRRTQAYLQSIAEGRGVQRESLEAWDDFYLTYDPLIRRYVGATVKRTDIDDYVQEIWAQLIQNLNRLVYDPQRGHFSSWLYQLVQNKVFSLMRSESRQAAPAPDSAKLEQAEATDGDPLRRLEREMDRQRVWQAIDTLRERVPALSFQVFYMRMMEGRSVMQVAWALNLSQQQVWFRQHRVKKHLCRLFEEWEAAESAPAERGLDRPGRRA